VSNSEHTERRSLEDAEAELQDYRTELRLVALAIGQVSDLADDVTQGTVSKYVRTTFENLQKLYEEQKAENERLNRILELTKNKWNEDMVKEGRVVLLQAQLAEKEKEIERLKVYPTAHVYDEHNKKVRILQSQLATQTERVKVLEAERDEAVKEADRVRTILNNSEVLRQMQLRDKAEQQLAQLQEALDISKDTANIEADRADRLQVERDKLKEENTRLKNLMGRAV